jgi:CMP-N-acetylneuraminic acid synthetase
MLWAQGSYLNSIPPRRQDMARGYKRDGTVYAFWRETVAYGDIYGADVVPLIIPPEETCPLDTPADWAEAERRLRERAT